MRILYILILLSLLPCRAFSNNYIDLDDSVDGGVGVSTNNWLVDRIAGNTYAGQVPYQGLALEAGDMRDVVKVVETPEGIYIASSRLKHNRFRLSLVQNGNFRLLMEPEGDYTGPIELAQGGFPAWSDFDNTLYLTGPNCLRKMVVAGDGQRTVEVVTGTCGVAGDTNGDSSTALLQENEGLVVNSDGNIYWLEGDNLRKITPAGYVTTVSLTWSGTPVEPYPYWDAFLVNDNLSLGEDVDTLYITDGYDTTNGYGALRVHLDTGLIEKYIGVNGATALATWVGTAYEGGGLQDGTPRGIPSVNLPDVPGTMTFKGSSEIKYHPFYRATFLSGNDNARFRWYKDGAQNVTTFLGVEVGGGDSLYNALMSNSLGIDGEVFSQGPIRRFPGDGSGEGVYVSDASDAGIHRAYDHTLTTEGGATFPSLFPDTSVFTGREGRAKAALMGTDGTLISVPFEVAAITDGVQVEPKVAYLNGTYLIVWTEFDGDDWDVKGVRILDDGTIIDTTPLEIDTRGRTQTMPDVAASSTDFMVVWGGFDDTETHATDPKTYVYAMRVPLSGAITDTRTVIDQGASPEIAYNATENKFFIAYTGTRDNSFYRLNRWSVINPDKTLVTENVTYDYAYGAKTEQSLSVTSLPGSEGWSVLWDTDHKDRHNHRFGKYLINTIQISGGEAVYDPDLVADGLDLPNVAYAPTSGNPAWYLEYSGDLTNQWPKGRHTITSDATHAVAIWQRNDIPPKTLDIINSDLYIGLVDNYDLVESSSTLLAGDGSVDERNPSIAGDGAGNLVAVYEKLLDGERVIASRSIDVSGDSLTVNSENYIIDENDNLWRGYPDIAYNANDDNYLVVWQEGAEGLTGYTYPADCTFTESTTLEQDGLPTPEQIAIFLPDNSFPDTMTATMRYRMSDTCAWTEGHDLYQIQDTALNPGFAWVITGLQQGTDYVVEVTTHDGATDVIETKTMTTSSLPAAAGSVTTNITDSMSEATIQGILDNASPGDVIQFADGTYNTTNLAIRASGSEGSPIYIRGESRDGVIISDTSGRIIGFSENEHVVLENMTLQGSGVDGGLGGGDSTGVTYWDGYGDPAEVLGNITLRHLTITGVDKGIVFDPTKQLLVYENVLEGNNSWTQDLWGYVGDPGGLYAPNGTPDIDENMMWGDDGMYVGGQGNAIFNNTLEGFGDSLACQGANGESYSVHFYRNKIESSGDDAFEADYGTRNISFYDNQITNAVTCTSVDQWQGGPLLHFRNICINVGRQILKIGGTGGVSGEFFYNNTFVYDLTKSINFPTIGFQAGTTSVPLDYVGFQNNLIVSTAADIVHTLYISSSQMNNIDWTNNGWYPDEGWHWTWDTTESYNSLAEIQAGIDPVNEIFSGGGARHLNDVVSEVQPFQTQIVLGDGHHTEITTEYIPSLTPGGVSSESGLEILGVTDGYSGAAPDRGAIISGRELVRYGANP